MTDSVYHELRKRLDMYSLGFPETESGIEIEILKRLFDEKEASFFLLMSPKLEDPASVAARLGMPAEEVSARLEDMAGRGLLFRLRKGDSVKYGAIPFMHGLLEFRIARLDPELAELFEKYYEEKFHRAIAGIKGLFLRPVPVERSIILEPRVAAFEDARAIIEKNDAIAVAECICRKEKSISGKGCGKPLETCFMFGSMARYYIDNGIGRKIDQAEALAILRNSQEQGLVTQPGTAQNPAGMCNCCGDCCGVLQAIKRFPRPAELVFSNYQAESAGKNCTACGACIDRCQMEAITLPDGGAASVSQERCIGCGLCVVACTAGAITLAPKQGATQMVPPATSAEQMLQIAKLRGIV